MGDLRIISADSHVSEPPDLWLERMDRKYRDFPVEARNLIVGGNAARLYQLS
jgi:hypothetical protein